jgi:hypothetical protein
MAGTTAETCRSEHCEYIVNIEVHFVGCINSYINARTVDAIYLNSSDVHYVFLSTTAVLYVAVTCYWSSVYSQT